MIKLNGIKVRLLTIINHMDDLEECDINYIEVKLAELSDYMGD